MVKKKTPNAEKIEKVVTPKNELKTATPKKEGQTFAKKTSGEAVEIKEFQGVRMKNQ